MKVATALQLERITARYWVIPTAVILLLMGLLGATLWLRSESLQGTWLRFLAYDASPEGARLLLSSVATATMTVVGVLFSVTVLLLQQASSQYTPRVIETFIRSAFSQLVLGIFTGTFLFCLLLLRQIHNPTAASQATAAGAQLPGMAITLAVGLAVLCLGLLIQFVHRIAHAVQSTHIIASITHDTVNAILNIERGQAEAEGDSSPASPGRQRPARLAHEAAVIPRRTGYLQALSPKRLARALRGTSWQLELRVLAGDYVDALDAPLGTLKTSRPLSPRQYKRVQAALEVGDSRTHAQDFRFGIRQLVDIALRSLSPGINDPTTAIEALNGVCSVLLHYIRHCASADAPTTRLRVGSGQVIKPPLEFGDVLSLSFEQILQSARNHPAVLRRVLEILKSCRHACERKDDVHAIEELMKLVRQLEMNSAAFRLRDAA